MKLSATFINATGNTESFDITEGFTLQDAYNVVANDDFAPTQINIQLENMNLPSYSLGSQMPIETAYDKIGRHSTAEIMAKHKISQQDLEVLLDEGANHELEHTSSILVAMLIAQDHLYEHLDYYKRLKAAKLAKGAVIEAVNNKGRYDDGGRVSFPIYTRMKNQIDKSAVKDFLFKYPQVELVMNRYVRTPNVKAGYLMFLSEKDMNDQNLENWGATIKGSMELPNGTKIKRYNWDFGNAEGFAEVFQYLYDKQNGYAKGGEVGADLSQKMMQDAQKMSSQSFMNAYSVDIAEAYMDAKNQYESHHKTDYPVTLGMYVNSLHQEYKAIESAKFKNGGVVDEKNLTVSMANDEQGERMYKMAENEIPYVGKPRLVLLDGKKVLGGVFVEQSESYELNGETITSEINEYKFDIIISRSHRGKGYAKLLIDRLILDFLENFPNAEQIRAEVINKKLGKYLVSRYGFDCDSDNDEDMTYCYLSREQAKKRIKKLNIKFEKGGIIAPNGKASNLTPEQYKMVRTPEFKAWFGDWENDPQNASKVVDENGEPLVVYRGDTASSKKGFVFKKGFNQIGYINKDRLPNQYFHYFVNSYDVALGYGKDVVRNHNQTVEYTGKGKIWNVKVTPYFLNIRNPIDITPNNPLFPTFKEFLNSRKKIITKKDFEYDKFIFPYFYGSEITNIDLYKILQDKLGQNYLEDRYISKDEAEYWTIRDTRPKESFLFFIEFNDGGYYNTVMSNILNKTYRTMVEKNVDGLLFLEMTHRGDEFWKNATKYKSGELKYDYKRWTEMPKVFAALESNQIKLADGTNTTFDSGNPDIRFDKGGDVNNKNYYRAVTEDLGLQTTFVPQNRYEAFDNMGNPITRGASDIFMLSDKLEISASKSVGGAILGLWTMFNSNGVNPIGKKVYIYAIDKKPYLDLSHVRMADFEYLQEVRYDKPISAKRIGYFEYDQKFNEGALNFYGRISDDDPYSEMEYDIEEWEDFEQYILTLNKSDLVMYKIGGKIQFDKGGYIDEQMFADQKLQKIDGIYVVDKSGKQRDSLGNFSYKAFGQYMMRDLAKELFDEYQIRLRSDFALMINGEVITPAIKVVQMTGSHIDYLALIYNAVVVEEGVVSYVYNEDGEFIDKFTDEDRAQEYVDADDGNYIEARVEEIQYPETIISMQFDFDTHKMTFVSSMLEKNNTHEFKYGGQL